MQLFHRRRGRVPPPARVDEMQRSVHAFDFSNSRCIITARSLPPNSSTAPSQLLPFLSLRYPPHHTSCSPYGISPALPRAPLPASPQELSARSLLHSQKFLPSSQHGSRLLNSQLLSTSQLRGEKMAVVGISRLNAESWLIGCSQRRARRKAPE
jgi:hypothetical protein